MEVLTALRLRRAGREPACRARGALRVWRALGSGAPARRRRGAARAPAGPDIAALRRVRPIRRSACAAVRVLGRVFARARQDDPIERNRRRRGHHGAQRRDDLTVKGRRCSALGAMRYARGVQALTALFSSTARATPRMPRSTRWPASRTRPARRCSTAQLPAKSSPRRGIAIEGLAAHRRHGRKLREIQTGARCRSQRRRDPGRRLRVGAALRTRRSTGIADALTRPTLRDQARQYLIELVARTHAAGQPVCAILTPGCASTSSTCSA